MVGGILNIVSCIKVLSKGEEIGGILDLVSCAKVVNRGRR